MGVAEKEEEEEDDFYERLEELNEELERLNTEAEIWKKELLIMWRNYWSKSNHEKGRPLRCIISGRSTV